MNAPPLSTLLLYSLRHNPTGTEARLFDSLNEADWDQLIELAWRQNVAPLLYHQLKNRGLAQMMPAEQHQRLAHLYRGNALRNLKLYAELRNVLRALAEAQIPVIVLKGAYLAGHIYPDPALRYMGDVDLLVKEADLNRARDLLLSLDFKTKGPMAAEQLNLSHKHLPSLQKADAITVELHWHIADLVTMAHAPMPLPCPAEVLWQRTQPIQIARVDTLTLSAEDVILHLCLHTALQHNFELGLRGLCDLDRFIEARPDHIDWEQLVERSRQWQVGKAVYLTLSLVKMMLDTTMPETALQTLKTPDFKPEFLSWAKTRVLNGFAGRGAPSLYNIVRVREAPRLQDKFTALVQTVFLKPEVLTPSDSSRRHNKWTYVYFLLYQRPKRLWHDYGLLLWRLWRKEKTVTAVIDQEAQGNAIYDWMCH